MSEEKTAQDDTKAAVSVADDSTGVLDTDGANAPADDGGVLSAEGEGSEGEGKPTETEEPDKSEGAPEKYEFKMPEGMVLDAAVFEAFEPALRELNLSGAKAQKLVDIYAGLKKAEGELIAKFYADQKAEALKIPKEQIGLAKRALSIFKEEAEAITKDIYMRNNPALIRYLSKIGSLVSEPKFREGGVAKSGNLTPEEQAKRFYPTMR